MCELGMPNVKSLGSFYASRLLQRTLPQTSVKKEINWDRRINFEKWPKLMGMGSKEGNRMKIFQLDIEGFRSLK
ncbi:MAG: hypothetical protein M1379_08380, partial [Firmicutes bacterium]|nr:hypothetical protein [Bacillota bacterium]